MSPTDRETDLKAFALGSVTNPWDIARAIWPGCFAEPWQDEQIDRGLGDWPTVWVVGWTHKVRLEEPPAADLSVRRPWWSEKKTVLMDALAPWVLCGPQWRRERERSVYVDQVFPESARNSAAIVRVRQMGHRWWCREDPFAGLAPVVDVQTGRSYGADVAAVARLLRDAVPLGDAGRLGYDAERKVGAVERRAARGLTG